MVVPELNSDGNLPEGTHDATFVELEDHYRDSPRRRQIIHNLKFVVSWLRERGVKDIWIDGSFVTEKRRPSDVDVVYRPPEKADVTTWDLLSPQRRSDLKRHYKVDLLPYPSYQPSKTAPGVPITIVEYFKSDRDGNPKGIIHLTNGDTDDH